MAHPIIDAQDNLKTILAARPAFSSVDIQDGGPTEGEDIRWDAFWFNDTTLEDGWNGLGANLPRRSTFNLGFTIAVRKAYDDERAARAQALVYFEDMLEALKASPANATLNGTVQQVQSVRGSVGSAPVDGSTWGAWFTGTLEVLSKSY